MLLVIDKLNVNIDNKKILDNFDLQIDKGEIHAIMGPNGCGKSTLSKTIMGDEHYKVISGDIKFLGEKITKLKTDEIARKGIFLAMQSPMAIEGVSNADFLRTALSIKKEGNLNLYQFIKNVEVLTADLSMDKNLLQRSLNVGFSGGERKKNEIIQMKLLEPKFIILDEIDSGLDIDSLRIVSDNINSYLKLFPLTSVLIITHYQRILDYIKPDFVHIMKEGKIIKTGDYTLALDLEREGFSITDSKDENHE